MSKFKTQINKINSIEELDNSNAVLFIGIPLIENYINGHITKPLKNIVCYPLKEREAVKYNKIIEDIIQRIKDKKYKLIYILYNCTFVTPLVNTINVKRLDVRIIVWHQKHYFNRDIVDKVFAVMEYSTIQARKQKYYNKKQKQKYIYIPYPSIMPSNYRQLVESNNEAWRERYTGKYIFAGGNNGRDYKSMVMLAHKNPDMNLILLFSSPKFLKRVQMMEKEIKKEDKNALQNLKYYTDSDMYQFAYAIQKCHFMILPFIKAKSMAGHSVVAQAIYFHKPVITNLNSSMDEAVRDNETGYLVACKDYNGYEKYSRMIWDNDELYQKLSLQMKADSPLRDFPHYESILVNYSKKGLLNQPIKK